MSTAKKKLNAQELALVESYRQRGLEPVGVDLASRKFQVCYVRKNGTVFNGQLNRDAFFEFIENKNDLFEGRRMLVGFESCGACNFWARKCVENRHEYRIIQPGKIKSFIGLDKTDAIDAFGIFKATFNASLPSITCRSEENQTLLNLLNVREQFSKQLIQTQNAHRALLYELGVVCTEGLNAIIKASDELLREKTAAKSSGLNSFKVAVEAFRLDEDNLSRALESIDSYIKAYAKSNEDCKRLMTIPGIAELSAVTLYAVMGNADDFPSSRHFAAFAGFAPKVSGTGGVTNVGNLRKTGNKLLKKVLYMCAIARFAQMRRVDTEHTSKISKLADNDAFSNKKLICAIANRLARVAWTVCKSKSAYDQKKCQLLG